MLARAALSCGLGGTNALCEQRQCGRAEHEGLHLDASQTLSVLSLLAEQSMRLSGDHETCGARAQIRFFLEAVRTAEGAAERRRRARLPGTRGPRGR